MKLVVALKSVLTKMSGMGRKMSLLIRQIKSTEEFLADKEFWNLFLRLSKKMRGSKKDLLKVFTHPKSIFLTAKCEEKTIGFISGQTIEKFPAIFIGYVAVNKEHRNRHVGTDLLKVLRKRVIRSPIKTQKGGTSLLVVEVGSGLGEKFFQSNDFQLVDCNYFQPPLKIKQKVEKMKLYVWKKERALKLSKSKIKKMVWAIYEEKYMKSYGIPEIVLRQLHDKL